jgi:diguanylate cyclase (GGDEF)-like protein
MMTAALDTAAHHRSDPDRAGTADLDAIARLAAYVCGQPAAMVVLDDAGEGRVGGVHGLEAEDALGTSDRLLVAAAPLLAVDGATLGSVEVFGGQTAPLDDVARSLLADLADQAVALLDLRRTAAALARASTRDALTGLANRRGVEQAIAGAIARAERGLGTPSVVVADLDGFAHLNAAFGRKAGDVTLRAVADRLSGSARTVDTVGRAGGDQFVVLLEHTGGPGATAGLRRLRESLDGLEAEIAQGEHSSVQTVGASLGMTTYRPGDSVASLLSRADAEMYAEKARRRVAG